MSAAAQVSGAPATREEMVAILTERARAVNVAAASIVLRELSASAEVAGDEETAADGRYRRLRLIADNIA